MIGGSSKHGGEKFKQCRGVVYNQYFRSCIRCLTNERRCQINMLNPFNQCKELASKSSLDMETNQAGITDPPKHPCPLPRARNLSAKSSPITVIDGSIESPVLEQTNHSGMQTPLPRTPLTRVQNLKLLDDYPNAISTPKSEASECIGEDDCNPTLNSSITVYERKTSTSTTMSSDSDPRQSVSSSGLSNDSYEKENAWLSKPRRSVSGSSPSLSKSSSGRSSPSATVTRTTCVKSSSSDINGCSNPFRTPNRSQRFEQRKIKLTLDYDAILRLDKLKQALNYVGVEPTAEQWNAVCSTLQATSSSMVRFGDFVNAVKGVLQVEMDLKGITTGSIFFAASNLNNAGASNNNQTLQSAEIASQVAQLKQENQDLHKQLDEMKGSLQERLEACLLAEREILFVRKTLQEIIEDKRALESRLSSLEAEKNRALSEQDEQRLSRQNEKPHEREIYLIAASKLLQFTKVVHNVLSEHNEKSLVNPGEKQRSLTRSETTNRVLARKPIRVNRTASVQSASGDVSNYFVRKYGGGGRICRAASTCTISHKNAEKENGNCVDDQQKLSNSSHGDSKDKLCRLAVKAQELITVFQSLLPQESVAKSTKEIGSYLSKTKSTNLDRNTHPVNHREKSSEVTIAWV